MAKISWRGQLPDDAAAYDVAIGVAQESTPRWPVIVEAEAEVQRDKSIRVTFSTAPNRVASSIGLTPEQRQALDPMCGIFTVVVRDPEDLRRSILRHYSPRAEQSGGDSTASLRPEIEPS